MIKSRNVVLPTGGIGPHRQGEVLVKLKGEIGLESDFVSDHEMKLLDTVNLGVSQRLEQEGSSASFLHLKLPQGQTTEQALQDLAEDPRVELVAPNTLYQLDAQPNDPLPQYGLEKIDAEKAWAVTKGSRNGPIVAVIDSGVDYNHPDLRENIWTNAGEIPGNGIDDDKNGVVDDVHGYNAARDNGDPKPFNHHGTHVAGTIGAVGNNGVGISGVNWEAGLMPINIFTGFGASAVSIAKALAYAERMGARIASCSFGGAVFNPIVYEAYKNSSMLFVCAAGNHRNNIDEKPHYPASFNLPNIVTVAATDSRDELARFSNYGQVGVDLAAPGAAIMSTLPDGKYGELSGTSMATPHVSGVAALVADAYPQAGPEEIRARLLGSVDRLPELEGKMTTGGRLNAKRALEHDNVAPGAPVGLSGRIKRTNQLELSWIASGDDGPAGAASLYDLRMSPEPIVEGEPGPREVLLSTPLPMSAGRRESLTVPLMPSSKSGAVHLALRSRDNAGNTSATASLALEVPAANLALELGAGSGEWKGEGPWKAAELSGLGRVWTDSPTGVSRNNLDSSLVSPAFSLQGERAGKLVFESRFSIEREKDVVALEISSDNGKNWSTLDEFDGDGEWGVREADLSRYAGRSNLRVRFRIQTDATGARDGFNLGRAAVVAGK